MGVEADGQLPFPVKLLEENGEGQFFYTWPDLSEVFRKHLPDLTAPEEKHMGRLYIRILNSLNEQHRLPRAAHLIGPYNYDSSKAGATHILQELLDKRRIIAMLSWSKNQDYLGTFPPARIFEKSPGRVSKHERAQRFSVLVRNYGNRGSIPRFR